MFFVRDLPIFASLVLISAVFRGVQGFSQKTGTEKFYYYGSSDPMTVGNGPRVDCVRVTLNPPFPNEPRIHLGYGLLDSEYYFNLRIDVFTQNINAKGFDICLSTWEDTRINSVNVNWIAYSF